MPKRLICCVSLPDTAILSVPIYDFAIANEELAIEEGITICRGCVYSNIMSGNKNKCLFCNSDQEGKSEEERVQVEMMRRVEASDPASICCWLINITSEHWVFKRIIQRQ